MTDVVATNQTILVVGGGISGMTAALEAAECGKDVILIEKNPALGGRVAQLYKYFPKMCHPTCGIEINLHGGKNGQAPFSFFLLLVYLCQPFWLFFKLP